jgi:hypothetical protein
VLVEAVILPDANDEQGYRQYKGNDAQPFDAVKIFELYKGDARQNEIQ